MSGIESQIYHVTGMGSRRECKLDRLKSEYKGAAKEAPTCAVSMHAPQTSSLWRRVGEVSSACEVGCGRKVQPRPFSKVAKGCVKSSTLAFAPGGLTARR